MAQLHIIPGLGVGQGLGKLVSLFQPDCSHLLRSKNTQLPLWTLKPDWPKWWASGITQDTKVRAEQVCIFYGCLFSKTKASCAFCFLHSKVHGFEKAKGDLAHPLRSLSRIPTGLKARLKWAPPWHRGHSKQGHRPSRAQASLPTVFCPPCPSVVYALTYYALFQKSS